MGVTAEFGQELPKRSSETGHATLELSCNVSVLYERVAGIVAQLLDSTFDMSNGFGRLLNG